jgi:hypothetical protein
LNWSQGLENSDWVKVRLDVDADVGLALNGETGADKIIPTAVSDTHYIEQTISGIPADTQVTLSFVGVRDGTSANFLRILVGPSEGWAGDTNVLFNMAPVSGTTVFVTALPSGETTFREYSVEDGDVRVEITLTTSSIAEDRVVRIYSNNNVGENTFTGDGTSGVILKGVQLDVGAPTIYQATEGDDFPIWDQAIFRRTIQMQNEAPILDSSSQFILPLSEFVYTDIPYYAGAAITIEMEKSGGTVLCGQIVMGDLLTIGTTTIGNTGFTGLDFSFVEQDDFGNLTTVRRAATRLSQFEVLMESTTLLGFDRLMRELRGGVAAVWIGDDNASKAAINYGFYRDYRAVYQTNAYSIMSLQIQGIV